MGYPTGMKRRARRNPVIDLTTAKGNNRFGQVARIRGPVTEDEVGAALELALRTIGTKVSEEQVQRLFKRQKPTATAELLDEQKTQALPDEVDKFAEAIEAFAENLDIDSEYLEAIRTSSKSITRSDREAAAFGIGRYDVHTIARSALFGRQITDGMGAIDVDAIDAAMLLSTDALDSTGS